MLRPLVMSLLRPAHYLANAAVNQLRYRDLQQHHMSFIVDCRLADHVTLFERASLLSCDIGRHTYVGARSAIAHATLGAFCSIGPNVRIGPGRHPASVFASTHPAFYSTEQHTGVSFADRDHFVEHLPTIIGADVWIGANALIADGLTIGPGAIVAAGAVVTQDVEPYSIVAGVPAKELRRRFSADDIAFLLQLRWWERDDAWLRANADKMRDIEQLRTLS